jgi:acetyl-CoA synthetase (ADP-forming)
MFYSEKEAENFLEKNGFFVIKRGYVDDEKELEKSLKEFRFPVVMKVSGDKIVHKNQIGGIILNIKSIEGAKKSFDKLSQISGFEGVIIQEQVTGKEILIGVKKTPDFGHAVCVGSGGVNTEKLKDVSFRIFPFEGEDAKKMVIETKISKILSEEEKKAVEKNIAKINNLIKKYPNISELDINPLIVNGDKAVVVDVRIVFG